MSLPGANDVEKLLSLTTLPHKEQVIWFLNSFWGTHSEEAERLWTFAHKFAELDVQKKDQGNELDELSAHRFLEFFHETLTVKEMRDTLRSLGAIVDKVKYVPIIHILIFRYKVDWRYLVNASQGDNQAELEEAQRKLALVQAALKESQEKAHQAAAALLEAIAREKKSKQREVESKQREEESRVAQAELAAALEDLKREEEAFNQKKADLERKSEEGGVVSRNKAKNELAQLLAEDPLPLRKAKITQEAAVKKAEKAVKAAEEAVQRAIQARLAAEEATRQSEAAKAAAERAVDEANERVAEAEAFIEIVKKKPGQAQGAIWWLERELHEARAYLPASKGGYAKKKV